LTDDRLKAEIESLRLKNDASLSSVRSSHDAEVRRLHDQLAESDNIRQQQIEQLRYEHTKQLEELHREMADNSELSETAKRKFEREKHSLEAELTKALQDLVTVKIVTVEVSHTHTCCFNSHFFEQTCSGRSGNYCICVLLLSGVFNKCMYYLTAILYRNLPYHYVCSIMSILCHSNWPLIL